MPKPIFSIGASELDAGGQAFKRPIPNAWLLAAFEESDATPIGDGLVDMRLSKSGTDVIVHGRVTADVELPCSRCLEPVRVSLHPEISVLMVPAAKMRRRESKVEADITEGEADVLPYDGENVVLDDVVRDDLLLDLPMIPLCSDSCPGIASAQEVRENERPIDPRLAPLLALKKQTKLPPQSGGTT
jgi:uncharacterized protein